MINRVGEIKFAILATDVVIFTIDEGTLKVALVKSSSPDFKNLWALPGGLVKPSEPIEDAGQRYLRKHLAADINSIYIEQLYTFGAPERDPGGRVVSVAYMALVANVNKSLTYATWFAVNALPALAYDHKEIIGAAIDRLRAKLGYTNIIYSILPNEFTLSELQDSYETILGRPLDKRNFRKKILSLNLIKSLGKKKLDGAHRPAQLFRFRVRKFRNIEVL